jgi:hypothetical protein
MVRMYEKYCSSCATEYKQDDMFWKNCRNYSELDIPLELKKDFIEKLSERLRDGGVDFSGKPKPRTKLTFRERNRCKKWD